MFVRCLTLTLTLAFGLSCAFVDAQIVRQGAAYRLRARYFKGQSFHYGFHTLVTQLGERSGSGRQEIALPVKMSVLQVLKGVAQIRNEVGPWKLNGKPFRDKTIVIVHVDAMNRIVRGPSSEVPNFSVQLPDQPIRIGQSWSSIVNTAGSTPEAIQVRATYTLKSVSGGKAVLGVSYSGGGAANSRIKTHGKGTLTLKTADASLVSMNVTQTVVLSPGVGAKTEISVKRIA